MLGQLLSFLDPVVASLNRARYPRETIVFLLVSLFILLAGGLHHHDLTMKLAAEERAHEHKMELTMLELMHSCPSTGANVSNELQVGVRQLRLEHRISSPEESRAPPAPGGPPPPPPWPPPSHAPPRLGECVLAERIAARRTAAAVAASGVAARLRTMPREKLAGRRTQSYRSR